MTFDFSKHDRRTVEVQFDDDTLSVTYRPSAYNENVVNHLIEMSNKGKSVEAQANVLSWIIVEWDATMDGKPLEPSADAFRRLGPHFANPIYDAIWADCLPENYDAVKGSGQNPLAPKPSQKPTPMKRKKGGNRAN